MHELMNYVCDELEELDKKASKGKLSPTEIEYADKLVHLKKNILRADELMDEGYSADSYVDGSYVHSYARGRGMNAKRDSRGRYSSDYRYPRYSMDKESVVQELRDIMNEAPEHMKSEIQRTITRMEQM